MTDDQPPRTGGFVDANSQYRVGEQGCDYPVLTFDMLRQARERLLDEWMRPAAEPIWFGDLEIPVRCDESLPEGLVLLVGSCSCGHPATGHNAQGCTFPGVSMRCACPTPVTRLAACIHFGPKEPS